jgi:radical SAM superfamily enzyme YgiQ (UPF0313 family)
MNIVVANAPGQLGSGESLVLFPSRWDAAIRGPKDFAYYPYELGYLSSLLKRDLPEHRVTMVDGNMPNPRNVSEGWDGYHYAQHILALQPDWLVSECSALTFKAMTECIRELKDQLPAMKAVLCGPLATSDQPRVLKAGWDYAVAGEYEMNVLRLIRCQQPEPGRVDIASLPWPEDEDIHRIDYWERSNPCSGLVQVYPTRGCPLSCTFCVVPLYYGGHGASGGSHRVRDPRDVCDEIEYLADRYADRFRGCFFNEETHNANVPWFSQFCQSLIDRGLNRYTYDAMCGYWPFSEELVQLAARAGYRQLRVGVENLSERSGKAMKKNVHADKLERFMHWCRDSRIAAYGTFQIGAPGSDEESDRYTVDKIHQWCNEGLMPRWQASISTPQPGTPFHAECQREGWLVTQDLSRYNGMHAVVSYPDYGAGRIEEVFQSIWK